MKIPSVGAWLEGPVFEDPQRSLVAHGLYRLALIGALVSIVLFLSAPLLNPELPAIVPFYLVPFGISIGTAVMVRRGQLRSASRFGSISIWLISVAGMIVWGGLRGPSVSVLPVVVLIAGVFWSGRAAVLFAALSVLATAVIGLAGHDGWLPAPPGPIGLGRAWAVHAAALTMTAALVYSTLNHLRRVLGESHLNERRFAELFRQSPDGLVRLDQEGRIEAMNPEAERLIGRPVDALSGRCFAELGLRSADGGTLLHSEFVGMAGAGGAGVSEVQAEGGTGEPVWLETAARRILRDDGSIGLAISLRDISARRQVEGQRADLESRLRQAQTHEAVGRLAGGIAHDFNNLLTVILGNARLLRAGLPQGEPLELVEEVETAAAHATDLTRQLVAFSRRQLLEPVVFDLNQVLRDLNRVLSSMTPASIELVVRPSAAPASILADPLQLERVILNLASNAKDAMPDGGRLTIESQVLEAEPPDSAGGPSRRVLLVVVDTGTGMDSETARSIFEPFFSTKERGKGTGLGLATVHGIVEQSGGTIEVTSAPGSGTRVRIEIPWVAPPDVPKAEPRSDRELGGGNETILLAEDDEQVLEIARRVLEQAGYRVLGARSADEAVGRFESEPLRIDLLLTDMVMPGQDGLWLARVLRTRQPDLRVLFMSGYDDDERIANDGRETHAALLRKPFTTTMLTDRVRECLDRSDDDREVGPRP